MIQIPPSKNRLRTTYTVSPERQDSKARRSGSRDGQASFPPRTDGEAGIPPRPDGEAELLFLAGGGGQGHIDGKGVLCISLYTLCQWKLE